MDTAHKLLIELAGHMQDFSCRCAPTNGRLCRYTGAAVCDNFACPRRSRPALLRVLQYLGGGSVLAGAAIVEVHHRVERVDCDKENNGAVLRDILESGGAPE